MATQRLTDKSVAGARPAEGTRYELWDAVVPGFGVRVTDKGRKTWFLMFYAHGRRRRMSLGTYPAKSLADAREDARKALEAVEKGFDPAADKIHQRKTRPQTFGELAQEYLLRHATPNKRTGKEDEKKLNGDVLPEWRHRRVDTLRRADVIRLIETVYNRGAPIASNRLLALIRKIFNWAMALDLVDANPAQGVKKLGREISRERVLTSDELKAVWAAAGKMAWPWNGIYQLLILTAQRRDEVAGMRWAELDLDKKTWTLEGERNKSNRAHQVPLPDAAVDILKTLPKYNTTLVFPARGNPKATTYASGLTKAKAELDKLSGVTGWRNHDLRRTAASGMAELGFAPHEVEKILNHTSGQISGVAAVYNRYGYNDEKRRALEAWAGHVLSLENQPPSNVVDIQTARKV